MGHSRSDSANPTHVLFIIDQLCEMGGAERTLLNMIRLMPREKYRCSLVTFKIEPSLGIFDPFLCPFHLFPLRRTYDGNALKVALRLRRLILSEQVDIVHTFFETSDLWGGLVAKLSGNPLLVSSRRDMGILRTGKHQVGYRMMNPLVDRVLTVSEQVRTFCINKDGLNPAKVVTLYNGIETEKVVAANNAGKLRVSLGLGEASHLITTVAHIRKVKGIDIFLRTAAVVCREFPRAIFLVVGDASEPEHFRELEELTRRLGVAGNVKFLGGLEDIYSLLKLSDVFCLLSRSEGFSNALVEAMACGLPCVATDVGGNREALEEGRSGFLVTNEDADTAADRVLKLLRSPDKARQMGEAGRKIVQAKFTSQAMMTQLVKIYDDLLATRRA